MTNLDKLAQTLVEPIPDRGTSPYETNATVIRLEDGIAWVQIPGGVEETPAVLAVAALPGDEVRVRVAGGKAFITGNPSAPPTDDTLAQKAQNEAVDAAKAADEAATQAEDANRTATGAARDASVAKETAESSYHIAANTNQYFWHTESGEDTGAHITEIPREAFLLDPEHGGGNLLARSNGIAVREGLNELAVMSADGFDAKSYDSNGNEVVIAHLGYGEGTAQSGTAVAPYYTLGARAAGSSIGNWSVAEGRNTTASGYCSYAEGYGTTASGHYSHAEGQFTNATGANSHAEGVSTTTSGNESHAEGYNTTASGLYSHAEGDSTTASAQRSHAEGYHATASGYNSHAEGVSATASGKSSHAEGDSTTASGDCSHAGGYYTIAQRKSQTAIGEFNIADTSGADSTELGDYAFIIGNGTSGVTRSNALTVDWLGRVEAGDYSGNFKSIFDIFYPVGSYYETSLSGAIPSGSQTPTAADMATLGVTWFNPNYAWGGTWEQVTYTGAQKVDVGTTLSKAFKATNYNTWEYAGLSFTVPQAHRYMVSVELGWSSGRPIGIGLHSSTTLGNFLAPRLNSENSDGITRFTAYLYSGTYYLWEKRAGIPSSNNTNYIYITDIDYSTNVRVYHRTG